jgi:ABC-type polar amino acid transport system ATPase subunit
MLKIDHLTKKFGNTTVLHDVSLQVRPGEIAVLLGSSGVGKSTLLRILNNLETITSGALFLDNQKLDLATVNKNHTVGFVFQNFNLFDHLTIEQNITLPLEKSKNIPAKEAKIIAHNLLGHYGLADKAGSYPSDLSGGQKQRVALARTLALKPKIVCLDEPTSALDPLLTAHVATNIQDLARQGYIVLIATHDTSLLGRLNCTIYLMRHGTIVETAQSSQLASTPEKYPQIRNFIAGI